MVLHNKVIENLNTAQLIFLMKVDKDASLSLVKTCNKLTKWFKKDVAVLLICGFYGYLKISSMHDHNGNMLPHQQKDSRCHGDQIQHSGNKPL